MNNCVNIIKLSISKNKKGFIINNNKNNFYIVKTFLNLNILKFIQIKKNTIVCYLNYINNKPIFKNIINMFKPSKKNYINIKELKKLTKKHNWILILSTNKGIINSVEAIKMNVGGLIIAVLWN